MQPFEMTPAGPMRSASSSELRAVQSGPRQRQSRAAGGDPTPVATAGVCAGDTPPPRVSIVIPAFNESRRIADSLGKLREFLGTTSLSFEILVVDDGSTDGTGTIVRRFEAEGVRLISHHERRGKGHSVRTGMLKAAGTYVSLPTRISRLLSTSFSSCTTPRSGMPLISSSGHAPSIDVILSDTSPDFARPVAFCSIAWCASLWG